VVLLWQNIDSSCEPRDLLLEMLMMIITSKNCWNRQGMPGHDTSSLSPIIDPRSSQLLLSFSHDHRKLLLSLTYSYRQLPYVTDNAGSGRYTRSTYRYARLASAHTCIYPGFCSCTMNSPFYTYLCPVIPASRTFLCILKFLICHHHKISSIARIKHSVPGIT
jgi:hypothetical protein